MLDFAAFFKRFGTNPGLIGCMAARRFNELDWAAFQSRVVFDLPSFGAVRWYLSLRSPRLCPAGTPYLFPKRDGSRPMQAEQLANNFKLCLRRELGLEVNLHLLRHFAAHLLLESAPGNYESARRLLGHSRLNSTINSYTGIETTMVSRRYGEIIEGLKQ